MGLENFTSDSTEDIAIRTRKKVDNIKVDREFWELLAVNDPQWCYAAARNSSETSAKALVQMMDTILENGIDHHKISEEEKSEIENVREEIAEDFIWD